MKMRLIGANVQRFDDLVSQAIKYEAWSQSSKMKSGRKYVCEMQKEESSAMQGIGENLQKCCNAIQGMQSKDISDVNEKLERLQTLLTELLGKSDKKKSVKCFNCQEIGHIRPNCPKLTEEKKFSSGARKMKSN